MKKLILLAVVVFGFTAISFGQGHTSNGTTVGIAPILAPAAISPAFAFGATPTAMAFGQIVNVKNGGTIHLSPLGVVTTSPVTLTCAASTPAIFTITGANVLPIVTVPVIYFPFTLGKLDIYPATDVLVSPDATPTDYHVYVGG